MSNVIETKRVHAADKSLRIQVSVRGKESLHPYDTEMPEQDAHMLAAGEAMVWAGLGESAIDVSTVENPSPGHYQFGFVEV